jgi:streptothricin acetyltransferase
MIEISIQQLTAANQADLNRCDDSFTVEGELADFRLRAEDGRIGHAVRAVTPYSKCYGPEIHDAQSYIGQPDRAAWLAYVDGQVAGQILVKEHWNRFANIWSIRVDPPFRRLGVGRRLMEQAVRWTRERGLPGVVLETQNINLAACRFYESCGFTLRGLDTYLYRGIEPDTREIALFYYLVF